MTRHNPHVRTPSLAPRWAYDRPNVHKSGHSQDSILGPLPARWLNRGAYPSERARVGDFAILDGRAHRITAIRPGFRSSRPKFELQDLACPDMPRHLVAWSEISRFARAIQDPVDREEPAPPTR